MASSAIVKLAAYNRASVIARASATGRVGAASLVALRTLDKAASSSLRAAT